MSEDSFLALLCDAALTIEERDIEDRRRYYADASKWEDDVEMLRFDLDLLICRAHLDRRQLAYLKIAAKDTPEAIRELIQYVWQFVPEQIDPRRAQRIKLRQLGVKNPVKPAHMKTTKKTKIIIQDDVIWKVA